MPASHSQSYRLTGRLLPALFVPWIQAHASRLGLVVAVTDQGPATLTLTLTGQEPLIEAMVLACSLGPYAVWVETIEALFANEE